jgi:hypothetical protein
LTEEEGDRVIFVILEEAVVETVDDIPVLFVEVKTPKGIEVTLLCSP